MSSKNRVIDLKVDGRVHDGFHFSVLLETGREIRLADSRAIDSLWAAIKEAKKKDPSSEHHDVVFSGARSMVEVEVEGEEDPKQDVGPLDGGGIYPASMIAGLRYAGTLADHLPDAAYEAAVAAMEAQQEASEATAEVALEGLTQASTNGAGTPEPPAGGGMSNVSDEDE